MKRTALIALAACLAILIAALVGQRLIVDVAPAGGGPGAASTGGDDGFGRPKRAPRGAAKLFGRVEQDGQPAPGAQVVVRGADTVTVVSGADGRFLVEGLAAEAVYVSATLGPLSSPTVGPVMPLVSGGDDVVLSLAPVRKALGVVVDQRTRLPLPGARIVSAAGLQTSDEAGRFELALSDSDVWLDVAAPGYVSRTEWIPGAAVAEGAALEVALTPAAKVSGQVVSHGTPVEGAVVWLERVDWAQKGERTQSAKTDAKGAFLLEVPDGQYLPVAVAPSGGRGSAVALSIGVGQVRTNVFIEVGDAQTVSGVVRRDGQPLPMVSVTLLESGFEAVTAGATTDGLGRFTIEGVGVGRYMVQVRAGAFAQVAGPFEHPAAESPWQVALTGGVSLSGRVDPPEAGARVRLRSGAWVGPPLEVATDAKGGFLFEGLSPGEVMVEAQGQGGLGSARGTPGVELVVPLSQSGLVLRLLDGEGGPLTDARLWARSQDTGAVVRQSLVAPGGRVTVSLPPGSWALMVEAPGRGRTATRTVQVGAAGLELQMSIERTTDVALQVIDSASKLPIEGALVRAVGQAEVVWGEAFNVQTLTDARGQAQLIAPLSGWLSVQRQGFQPARFDVGGYPAVVLLVANPRVQNDPMNPARFEGVGMVLDGDVRGVLIRAVNRGGAAEQAGVMAGDRVLGIDGATVAGTEDAVRRIRGPAGTVVTITFERNGQPRVIALRRRLIAY